MNRVRILVRSVQFVTSEGVFWCNSSLHRDVDDYGKIFSVFWRFQSYDPALILKLGHRSEGNCCPSHHRVWEAEEEVPINTFVLA